MKSIKIFGFYTLLFAMCAVGIAAGLSNASTDTIFMVDEAGTVPTRSPMTGGTVPTRVPDSGGTVPTRSPHTGGTVPTRVPDSGGTVPTRVPDAADSAVTDQGSGFTTSSSNDGSMIVLQTSSADGDDWVTVEWLAGDGNWYQVDGWRGNIHNGEITWWVDSANLAQGPFRWVIYADHSQADQLHISEAFMLPEAENMVKTFSASW